MKIAFLKVSIIALSFAFSLGCTSSIQKNLKVTPAELGTGYVTQTHRDLVGLPEPSQQVVVAVYKFRDQTGQYKTSTTATSFSTAVTQGATSILLKALEDSGWFVCVEREGLPNLLNERKIIRSTRMQAGMDDTLPAMLYGGMLLEGGIISYDTNLISGGLGAKYFGLGGSTQVRRDQITVYLRAVSVQSGQVLKTVTASKSILSQEVDFGLYRFVSYQRLLELEAGYSTNEPPSVCVQEAVEKAVHALIVEGIQEGLWSLKDPKEISNASIQSYFTKDKQITDEMAKAIEKESKRGRRNTKQANYAQNSNSNTTTISKGGF